VLTVVSESVAAVDAIAAGLGRYPDELGIGGEVTISVRVGDDASDDPGWPDVSAESTSERLTIRCGSSVATVDLATGNTEMTLAPSLCAIPDAVRLLAEGAFTATHVARGRMHAVHSALVAYRGVGLLLRGPSGAGKSTITYSCLRRGMSVVSDDWVYAKAGEPADVLAGYPWRLMLTEDAARRFDELAAVERVAHTSAEGWKIPVRPPVEQQVATQRVEAVVLLDPSDQLSLDEVDSDEALSRFWDSALPSEREHLHGDWVESLLDRPTFVLRRGPSPDAAAALLEEVTQQWSMSS
jgi:HPr Serine kinase C-terminal domain